MTTSLSFAGALSEWLAARCLNRKPKTVEFYRDVVRLLHRAAAEVALLNVPADEITAGQILEIAHRLAHVCPSRWNQIVSALRAIAPHLPKKLLPRQPCRVREFTPPTQAQFAALLAECDAMKRSRAGLIVRFLCFTGLRIGEARGLTWADVQADCICVPAHLSKNRWPRSVPMVPGLAEVLSRLRGLASAATFVLPRGNCRKALEAASRRACGVAWSAHLCRHFYATRCIQSGVDLPTVARWLGHRDGGGLLARTYFHLADGHSQAMAARVRIHGQPETGEPPPRSLGEAAVCEFV